MMSDFEFYLNLVLMMGAVVTHLMFGAPRHVSRLELPTALDFASLRQEAKVALALPEANCSHENNLMA